jgi:hypothetical protein
MDLEKNQRPMQRQVTKKVFKMISMAVFVYRESQTDKHLPPSTFIGHFQKSLHLGFCVYI